MQKKLIMRMCIIQITMNLLRFAVHVIIIIIMCGQRDSCVLLGLIKSLVLKSALWCR